MIDLHLHLDGSITPKNLIIMAQMANVELPSHEEEKIKERLTASVVGTSLGEYLEKFELPLKVLQTQECIDFAVYELLRELKKQGLCYAEIRFAPQLHRERGLTQEMVVQAAVCGLLRGKEDFKMQANLILCCMRGENNVRENLETISTAEKFLGKGVCAVDLAGNEAVYATKLYQEIFETAKERKIPIIIHAGEAAGPESIYQALELGAVRIGHGIHAMDEERLMEVLKEKNIYLEMCYSSNLQTKAVMQAKEYPLLKFQKKGLKVTLNTDNMTVSDTNLKKEYLLLKKQFALDDSVLFSLALQSVDAAFLADAERQIIKEQVNEKFDQWLYDAS